MHILSSSQASLLPINTALKALFTAVTNTGWAGYVLLLTTVTAFADTATTAHAIDQDAAYHVSGLSQPAHIIVDEWGVPHLYAKDHYDVFFVQGFNAARDRLWQIDLWRRRGLGLLSEVLGSAYAEQDRAARLFLYRQDMYSEWLAYGNDAKRITEAFTDGINAYVDLVGANPKLLPPEFALLGYQPARWQPDDVVRIRSNGLWRNVATEAWRARMACRGKLDIAARWKVLEPTWETRVPEGMDPCVIPNNVLDTYFLAKAPVSFEATQSAAKVVAAAAQDAFHLDVGSNNWVVHGNQTDTGRPILADDPHRGHAVPSLRYISHLKAPGINVIGAGEPALPGISIGHNERIAFGLTIFPIDQEDLYVYERAGGKPEAGESIGYSYQGRVEPIQTIKESIPVRGGKSIEATLTFTRHGPIVAETDTHLFAVRAAWLEPGMAPYFGSIEYMRASNFRTFIAALNRWGAPSENQVYADVDGNIGYKPAGRFPKRDNWDGLLPVPGDGRYEWDGYFDMDVLPEEYNPQRGFSGTANALSLPDDYPIDDYKVGFEWSAPWRYKRLWSVLENDRTHTMQDSKDLQRDYTSLLSQAVLQQLPELPKQVPDAGTMLSSWDGSLEIDSPAAALWAVWYFRHLNPGLSQLLLDDGTDLATMPDLDSLTVLQMLETDAGKEVAINTLATAFDATQELLGQDTERWSWGQLHQIRFQHPLLALAPDALQSRLRLPELPRGGSANTTNNTGFGADSFDVRSGASFRMVVDVGNWDAARMTNAPGQSGDPRSRFYQNLLKVWATEGDLPLVFSDEKVLEHQVLRIDLIPAKSE